MAGWKPIPGETPIDDVSGLRLRSVRSRSELAAAEAENIRKAVVRYLAAKPNRRIAPFSLNWLLKLHREMFGDVWKWAGKLRQRDLNLGASWHQLAGELQGLLDNLAYREAHWPDWIEQAAHLHHRAARIHPFLNGNGRWARLLSNIWLRQHAQPLTLWPEETIGNQSTIRNEYLKAIRLADDGRMKPLVELHRRFSAIN